MPTTIISNGLRPSSMKHDSKPETMKPGILFLAFRLLIHPLSPGFMVSCSDSDVCSGRFVDQMFELSQGALSLVRSELTVKLGAVCSQGLGTYPHWFSL